MDTDAVDAATAFGANAKLFYNLDVVSNGQVVTDNTILLNDLLSTGSGKSDYYIYIPVELVYGADGVKGGTGGNADIADTSVFEYLYLYSQFGLADGGVTGETNGGFEEWSVLEDHALRRDQGLQVRGCSTAS